MAKIVKNYNLLLLSENVGRMNVYLTGYMGSGKTTAGRRLAAKIGYEYLDIDELFESTYRVSVAQFFERYDEGAFRKIEAQLIGETFALKRRVVSLGGGAASYADNMERINRHGLSVYLRMAPESLFVRLKNAKRPRPRIAGLSDEQLKIRIAEDLRVRVPYYEKARLIVKGENLDVDALAEEIIRLLPAGG
ncbi:MAG TPA: shikimate kinase [Bacteroidales bacterium]|nr:shikimate kinase [Bacteroidales bacterium]